MSRPRGATPHPSWWPIALLGLFCVSLCWRLLYIERLAHGPLADSLNADSRIYWNWATAILHGGRAGMHPFFMGPLYPYVLAGTRLLVGDSISNVLVVQALWGSAAVVLLADASRRLAGGAAALVLGLLLAGYEMGVFFDGLILMESLLLLLESLLIWIVVVGQWEKHGVGPWIAIGLAIGLLAQGRATALLLLLPTLIVALQAAPAFRLRAQRFGLVLAAVALTAIPGAIWNWAAAHEVIPFTYNLGFNLYAGNNPGATGSFAEITEGAEPVAPDIVAACEGGTIADGRDYLRRAHGLDLGPSASSSYWATQAWQFVRADPRRSAGLALRKAAMDWSWREYPQIEAADLFRSQAGPLGIPLLGTFACLVLLGCSGWGVASDKRAAVRFVLVYLAVETVAVLPFFVTDRYRVHLVPGLAVLAGCGLGALGAGLRAGRWQALARPITGAVAGVILLALPVPVRSPALVSWSSATDLANRWLEKDRPDLALPLIETAIGIDRRGELPATRTATACVARADLYADYGAALLELGRWAEALPWFDRAYLEVSSPGNASTLAAACAMNGCLDRARALFGRLGIDAPAAAEGMIRSARHASEHGRTGEAEGWLTGASAMDSTREVAWIALTRLEIQLGRFDAATNTLAAARRHGADEVVCVAHEALIAAAAGDLEEARRLIARVPVTRQASDGRLTEALAYVRSRVDRSDGSSAAGRDPSPPVTSRR